MKRSLTHENIDIFFLLNENRILTQSELKKVLPKENYGEYIKGFYRRRLIDIFNKNYECPWFAQKYLKGKKEFKVWNFDFKNVYYLISEVSVDEDFSRLSEISGYINHYLITPEGFKMSIVIEMKEERNISEDILPIFVCNEVKIDLIKQEDLLCKDKQNSNQEILNALVNFYKIDLPKTDDPLRNVFLYCTSCNKQYDSDVEMNYKCNKNCVGDTRRKELLANYTDFSYMKNVHMDFIIKSNIIKYEETVYQCAYCDKRFESENFINLHYEKKHKDELELRNKKYEEYKMFIDNIDLRILHLAEGSLEGKPWYAKLADNGKVVYDMNRVFSGDIVL
ncbi:hypothetical protein P3W45_000367 [Vairimorpha bombi]|jgi:DNA-directed RNA polymerase subunit RPC12/RpoP